jgi:cell wall-associated NlpC family hydrolase
VIFSTTIVRARLTTPIIYTAVATMLSFSPAHAEPAAPAGGLWYPVDRGLVSVTAGATDPTRDDIALYQDAPPDASTGEWVEPATADPPVADAAAPDQAITPAATEEWVDPAPADATMDTASNEAPADSTGPIDPGTGEWTDPAPVDPASAAPTVDPVSGESIDPATVNAGDPAPVDAVPAAPAPSTSPLNPPGPGGTEPWGEPIATAYISGTGGDGAPCLTAPQWGAETLVLLGEGEPVEVRAETMGEWQPVNCAGAGGYVHVNLIAWTPTSSADPAPAGGEQPAAKTGGGEATGEQIASFALQFQGYPYVYAGEGPYAFDCSGFTMFVIHNTLGIDIPHDMFVQYQMGLSVSRDALQPGDLVFFANTFRPGMSHNGIYIGGGQFVHAETESSGVTISDLDSDYYRDRWYGAVRFT